MSKILNIEEYGAIADGKTLCTEAIQSAIDACNEAGGGLVHCGAGNFLIGSIDHIIRNCTFSNIVIKNSRTGINFDFPEWYKAVDPSGGADVSNIAFTNFIIECEQHPIKIWADDFYTLTQVKDISFSNMRIKSGMPVTVKGSINNKIENICFNNIQIESSGDGAIDFSNCKGIKLNNVEVSTRA